MEKNCNICGFIAMNYNGLGSHIKQYHRINTKEYYDIYIKKDSEGKCEYCGKESSFDNLNKGYRRYCGRSCSKKIQPNCKGWAFTKKEGYTPWNKGLNMSDEHKKNWRKSMELNNRWKIPWNIGKKMTESHKENWRKSMIEGVWGKTSEETKKKLRLKMAEKLKKLDKNFHPPYNPKGCEYFNRIMREQKIIIQHAENGGEFYIKELGYWIDGYDKENNVVYEWDENNHYIGGKLKEKDIIRQNEITDFLKCNFVRIKQID